MPAEGLFKWQKAIYTQMVGGFFTKLTKSISLFYCCQGSLSLLSICKHTDLAECGATTKQD